MGEEDEHPYLNGAHAYLEQALDLIDLPSIRHEKNDMVICFYDRIMVSHQDIIPPHDGADGGATWQLDVLDSPTHHP